MGITRLPVAFRGLIDDTARRSPVRLVFIAFPGVIAVVTGLLLTPAATSTGRQAHFADAFFTATSAVCVTGLTTVSTGTFWSAFGQAVILVGIATGGLGVMVLASILTLAVARRIGLTQRLLTAPETSGSRLGEVGSLVRLILVTSVSIELAITAVLVPRFAMLGESATESIWHGVFYGISSFNNAGFVPTADGLTPYQGDWWLCSPILIGVFLGSLGFPVIHNIALRHRLGGHLSLHTTVTLASSAVMVVGGTVLIGALEWGNPATLGSLDMPSRILAALFSGVMPRSGGFSIVDTGGMHDSSLLATDAAMFIGGGSASTAGGIKVTTLAVLLLAIVSEARGDRDIEAFRRRIPSASLRLAVAVTVVGAAIVAVASLALLQITGWSLTTVLFETTSAFGNSGLSTGMTPDLPDAGKIILAAVMFLGRTGTMTLAAALALRDRRRVIRYPKERPIIG